MATYITNMGFYNTVNRIDFGEKVLFLKFGGDWCEPCKQLEKNMECIPDIILYNISIENEEFQNFIETNEISNIPFTIVKYRDIKTTFKGVKSVEELNEIIKTIKPNHP